MKGKIVRVKLGKENLHDRIKVLQLWRPDKELFEMWDASEGSETQSQPEVTEQSGIPKSAGVSEQSGIPKSAGVSEQSGAPGQGDGLKAGEGEMSVAFGMVKAKLDEWTSDVSGYPRGAVRFRFPEADRERVSAWMTGDFGNVSEPASDTLLKNVTAAVQGGLGVA